MSRRARDCEQANCHDRTWPCRIQARRTPTRQPLQFWADHHRESTLGAAVSGRSVSLILSGLVTCPARRRFTGSPDDMNEYSNPSRSFFRLLPVHLGNRDMFPAFIYTIMLLILTQVFCFVKSSSMVLCSYLGWMLGMLIARWQHLISTTHSGHIFRFSWGNGAETSPTNPGRQTHRRQIPRAPWYG